MFMLNLCVVSNMHALCALVLTLSMQFLDGPYSAFVASIKLEGAFLEISQRDATADAALSQWGPEDAHIVIAHPNQH